MKKPLYRDFFRRCLWGSGVALSAFPTLLMLVTGGIATAAQGRILMDFLLPAELWVCSLGGMALLLLWSRGTRRFRLFAGLLLTALGALVLCLGAAALSVIGSGSRSPEGPCWWGILGFLILYDLAVLAAPLAGLLFRKNTE